MPNRDRLAAQWRITARWPSPLVVRQHGQRGSSPRQSLGRLLGGQYLAPRRGHGSFRYGTPSKRGRHGHHTTSSIDSSASARTPRRGLSSPVKCARSARTAPDSSPFGPDGSSERISYTDCPSGRSSAAGRRRGRWGAEFGRPAQGGRSSRISATVHDPGVTVFGRPRTGARSL